MEKPNIEATEKKFVLKTLPESVFFDRDLTVSGNFYRKSKPMFQSTVDLSLDSWVIAFCGHRGAGKNLFMSYLALKAAKLYKMRLLTNYPLGVRLKTRNGKYETIMAEPLDVARMLEFDSEYDNCIIAIQEAPTIINRMAAPTWKNRLLNLWLQELRHSHSSLFYESQNEFWVDGELRWQTDLVAYLSDASRRYPRSGLARGGVVLASVKDQSGMWTGRPFDELPVLHRYSLNAIPVWGTYDSYYKSDIWESLRRVDFKLAKVTLHQGEGAGESYADLKAMAGQVIDSYLAGEERGLLRKDFYSIIPGLTESYKHRLANDLAVAGMRTVVRDNASGDYFLDFSQYDRTKL